MSARFALRAATAQAHERVDKLYSRLDLSHDDDYRSFLSGHARAFIPVEHALAEAGAGDLIPDWGKRRRAGALLDDLAMLGLAAPPPCTPPPFTDEAMILGGAYVLEGSRLGGGVLRKTVEASLPTSFLEPGNPAEWRAFISILDRRLRSQASFANAAAAALNVFALFERAAQTQLGAIERDSAASAG